MREIARRIVGVARGADFVVGVGEGAELGGKTVTVAAVSRDTAPRSRVRKTSRALQNRGRTSDCLALCALLYSREVVGLGLVLRGRWINGWILKFRDIRHCLARCEKHNGQF